MLYCLCFNTSWKHKKGWTCESWQGRVMADEVNKYKVKLPASYTKKYKSEKMVTEEGWQHTKVELIPLNKEYDTIVLDGETEYRTIGILKCVL